jgi:hypothetical protein
MKSAAWAKFWTRKFVAATLTAFLMAACWVASEWMPNARPQLPALLTGLVGALSAYTAGNVLQDHVMTIKSQADVKQTVVEDDRPTHGR